MSASPRMFAPEESSESESGLRYPPSHWPTAAGRLFPRARTIAAQRVWEMGALFLLLLTVRTVGLVHQSLWYDEGYTLTLASATSFHEFWARFGAFTTSEHLQPLYYFLIFCWCRVAGTSDAALRLPSVLFSSISGVASYWAISPSVGVPRRYAVLGALGIAFSGFSVYYAQEARPYALLQMLSFVLLAVWMHCRTELAQDSEVRPAMAASLAAICALCMIASPFTALLALSVALSDVCMMRALARRSAGAWWRLWRGPILASSAVLGLYLATAISIMPTFIARDVTAIKQPIWRNILYSLYGTTFGVTLPPSISSLRGTHQVSTALAAWPILLPCALVLAALMVGGALLLKRAAYLPEEISSVLLTAAIYLSIFILLFGVLGRLNILPRHASAAFALLFLLAALLSNLLRDTPSRTARVLYTAGLAGWFVMNSIALFNYAFDDSYRKDDYRATAHLLAQQHSTVFLIGGQMPLLARYGAPAMIDATDAEPADLADFVTAHAGGAPNVQIVMNDYRNFRWDRAASVVAALAPAFDCKIQNHLPGFHIYSCVASGNSVAAASVAQRTAATGHTDSSAAPERPDGDAR